jgi:hypothetical protein
VTPTDVSGEGLGLALNAPAPAPLATSSLCHPGGGALLLGVLGASHVVAVEHPAGCFSEQVSCTARSHGIDLPQRTDAPGYSLRSRTETHDEASFRRLARDLRERCARQPGWLGGTFPGDDAALTALAAEPDGDGWRWQTWHLYPAVSGGTVVHTASRWHP